MSKSRTSTANVTPLCALLVIAGTLLTSCATVPSEGQTCPPVVEYTPEQQTRAADELEALPAGSMLGQMILDYGVQRDVLRACRNEL